MADDTPRRIAQYEILRLIGRGGMGVLYQARDTVRRRDVALKVMSSDIIGDEEARARFRQEAQLAERQHRNLVKVFEFGEDGDVPFIAMEFLRGRTLADRMASSEPFTLEAKLDIVTQVCDGLQCLHEGGIVHRDVKPSNIWLLEDGGVKLLDLGVAKHGSLNVTQYGNVVGSVAYIAPEQLSGARVDGRADIFSAGVVLFELLSGQRPFHSDSITGVMMKVLHEPAPDVRALVPDVPSEVARAVETALQKNPDDRYAEAADFAADLRLARAVAEVPLAERMARPPQRDITLDDTVISPVVGSEPLVVHDPILRSHPAVSPVGTTTQKRDGHLSLWIAVAVVVLASGGAGVWFALRSSRPAFELDVRSMPSGAAISIDGTATGQRTPALLPLKARPGRIGLSLEGYEPIDAALTANADSRASLQYTLRRLLQVQSDPPGASIALDGADTGQVTPSSVSIGNPIPENVELRLEGHEPGRAAITSAVLQAGELRLALTPVPPVEAPAPAAPAQVDVRLSGQYPFEVRGCGTMSAASIRHTLKVTSPCTLRLLAPEYFLDDERAVKAPGGGRLELTAPPLAKVQLRTRHLDCALLIEGRSLGFPPVDVELVAGTYSVTIQCKDQTLQTKPFAIDAGTPVRRIDEFLLR